MDSGDEQTSELARDYTSAYPQPTSEQPDMDELEEMADEGLCSATDGCFPLETDGVCVHGFPSWMLFLGFV